MGSHVSVKDIMLIVLGSRASKKFYSKKLQISWYRRWCISGGANVYNANEVSCRYVFDFKNMKFVFNCMRCPTLSIDFQYSCLHSDDNSTNTWRRVLLQFVVVSRTWIRICDVTIASRLWAVLLITWYIFLASCANLTNRLRPGKTAAISQTTF